MTYTKRAVQGAGIVFLMSMLGSIAAYAARVVLARELGPEQYGLFYSVFTTVIFVLFFRDLGFPQALIKYVAEYKAQGKLGEIKSAILGVFSMQLLGSLFLGILFFFAADFLAEYYFKNENAVAILNILIIYIFGSVLFIISKDTLLGFQETALFSLGEFLKNTLVLLLVLLFLFLGYGMYAPAYAYATVCFLLFLFFFPFLVRSFPFFKTRADNFPTVSKTMLWFALPVFATAAGSKVIGYLDTLMLTYFRSLEEVGVYNVVLPTALLFLYAGTAVGTIILPLASELWAKQDFTRLREGLRLLYKYLLVAAIPLVGAFIAFGAYFLQAFFGSEYLSGVLPFQVLLVGVLFFMPTIINHNIFSAMGKPSLVTAIILGSAAVNVIINIFLIPRLGILGAAIATSVSYGVALVWSLLIMKRQLGVSPSWRQWGLLAIVGSGYVLVLRFLFSLFSHPPLFSILISLVVGISLYLLVLYLLNIIQYREIRHYIGVLHGQK